MYSAKNYFICYETQEINCPFKSDDNIYCSSHALVLSVQCKVSVFYMPMDIYCFKSSCFVWMEIDAILHRILLWFLKKHTYRIINARLYVLLARCLFRLFRIVSSSFVQDGSISISAISNINHILSSVFVFVCIASVLM